MFSLPKPAGRISARHLAVIALLMAGVTVWRLTLPSNPSVHVDVEHSRAPAEPIATSAAPSQAAVVPSVLARPRLESAQRDPFADTVQAPVVVTAAQPAAPAAAIAAVLPSAPHLNLQFSGRLLTPGKDLVVYATLGNEALVLTPGQTLSNGYRVDAITADAVSLSYPALGAVATLPLPPAPLYEVR